MTYTQRSKCSCLSHIRFVSIRSMLKMWMAGFACKHTFCVSIHLNNETNHKNLLTIQTLCFIQFNGLFSRKWIFAGERLQLTSTNHILRGFSFKSDHVCICSWSIFGSTIQHPPPLLYEIPKMLCKQNNAYRISTIWHFEIGLSSYYYQNLRIILFFLINLRCGIPKVTPFLCQQCQCNW